MYSDTPPENITASIGSLKPTSGVSIKPRVKGEIRPRSSTSKRQSHRVAAIFSFLFFLGPFPRGGDCAPPPFLHNSDLAGPPADVHVHDRAVAAFVHGHRHRAGAIRGKDG